MDHPVARTDTVWIPMSDGTRLAATLWRPDGAGPVPAILEIVPYRRRDVTWARDATIHPRLAAAGFACLRVDMRGSGDSEGLLSDSVKVTAGADTEECIAWIAARDWCDGQVGMVGISWGGANVIFTAARRPPALKAAVACCFSHDTYQFGMFYRGGAILNRVFGWATTVTALNARPPDPDVVDDWRGVWRERLSDLTPQLDGFLRNQSRGPYWDNRLIRDWSKVDIPLWLAWGQHDPMFANAAADLLPRLHAPWQAWLTPSMHRYPHQSLPGPSFDAVGEWIAFFGRVFAGQPAFDRPGEVRAFRREGMPPGPMPHPETEGTWVAAPALAQAWDVRTLTPADVDGGIAAGVDGGEVMPWCAFATGPELPAEQTPADAEATVWDWPVDAPLDLLGRPVADLSVVPDAPVAQLALRLMDVDPSGRATRIGFGVASLNRADSDRTPRALVPGEAVRVSVPLDVTAYRLRRGHVLRLSATTGHWPQVWPAPAPVRLRVDGVLRLPVASGTPIAPPPPPPPNLPTGRVEVTPPRRTREVDAGPPARVTVRDDMGTWRIEDHGMTFATVQHEDWTVVPADPTTATARVLIEWRHAKGPMDARVVVEAYLQGDADAFASRCTVHATDGGGDVHRDVFESVIPREWN
ncbi:CocE/NonD family hydrolase [Jannaschia sp. LMIT008]|uniref:CocE/NonD family hydrolase n=1 Tax=Jannaschia maritima TaxID=3032585 RepID=UPI002811928D|nr:CocE/NonD family hydrolase [Jannaschia sp. LMIT008]